MKKIRKLLKVANMKENASKYQLLLEIILIRYVFK